MPPSVSDDVCPSRWPDPSGQRRGLAVTRVVDAQATGEIRRSSVYSSRRDDVEKPHHCEAGIG
jgi:hypothetical protein